MPDTVTVLIADALRMPALRASGPIAGSVMYFSDANLASALESIRTQAPKVIALESHFAELPAGKAFIDRLRGLDLQGSELKLLSRVNGNWSTAPLAAAVLEPADAAEADADTDADADAAELNTRRAPRFAVLDPAQALIDGAAANLIDVSALGAQVISEPVLRPKQRIKVTFTEDEAVLQFVARVAWSVYEKIKTSPNAHYRAGLEFDEGTKKALEEFCKRHCSDAPLPYRK